MTPIKSHPWSTAQLHPLFTPYQNQGFQVGLGTQQGAVCQLRAHPDGFSEPISNSTLGKMKHPQWWTARAKPPAELEQTTLVLLLEHILKVTGEARQGETNVCHLHGPPGHIHTSNLATPQEIIPLEGTGSWFSIPFSLVAALYLSFSLLCVLPTSPSSLLASSDCLNWKLFVLLSVNNRWGSEVELVSLP